MHEEGDSLKRNHLLGTFLISFLVMAGPAGSAPASAPGPGRAASPATRPVVKPGQPVAKPVRPVAKPGQAPGGATLPAAPAVVIEPPARLPATFDPLQDLPRLAVGNQAGLLKVFERQTGKEAYFRTLDDRNSAFFTKEQREAIFGALALTSEEIELAARQVMIDYPKLNKRGALAFLGVVGSIPDLEPGFQAKLQRYLAERYATEKDNILRRQALLSLALMDHVDAQTVEVVLGVFETEDNLWVTFPVPMFFEHHSGTIRQLAHAEQIRGRARSVSSLYTENVMKALGGPGAEPPKPGPASSSSAPAPEPARKEQADPRGAAGGGSSQGSAQPGDAAVPSTGAAPL